MKEDKCSRLCASARCPLNMQAWRAALSYAMLVRSPAARLRLVTFGAKWRLVQSSFVNDMYWRRCAQSASLVNTVTLLSEVCHARLVAAARAHLRQLGLCANLGWPTFLYSSLGNFSKMETGIFMALRGPRQDARGRPLRVAVGGN